MSDLNSLLSCATKGRISLCGIDDIDTQNTVLTLLASYNIQHIPWSNRLAALIVGDTYIHKWKYKKALEMNIPIFKVAHILTSHTEPMELWVEKYRPKNTHDIIGNSDALETLRTWLSDWKPGQGAFLTGPPGVGKTSSVHIVANACGYDIIEYNASDARSATTIRTMFETAERSQYVGKRRLFLMDEVDGMSSGDRGGVGELTRIIRKAPFPIVCIANERTSPRMRPFNTCCIDIRFQRPFKSIIAKTLLATVCKKENIQLKQSDLEMMCEQNGNDIRQIINHLQFQTSTAGNCKDALQRLDAFSATGKLFGSKQLSIDDRMNLVFVDFNMVPLMVSEAYVAASGKSSQPMENCAKAADCMSDWDLIDTKIHKGMNWGLLPAATTSIVRVAANACGPAPFQIFPQILGKMSKRNKIRNQIRDLRQRTNRGTTEGVLDVMELMRAKLFQECKTPGEVLYALTEQNMTRDDMLELLVETAFDDCGGSQLVKIDSKLKSAITREWNKKIGTSSTKIPTSIVAECNQDDDDDDDLYEL